MEPSIDTNPSEESWTKIYVISSPSISLPSNEITASWSSSIIAFKSFDIGASLIGLTVIATTPVLEVKNPSVTVYVKDVFPLKFKSGTNVAILPTHVTLPLSADWSILYSKSSPSISEAISVKSTSESSSTSRTTSSTVGASLIGIILNVKLWVSIYCPSLTVTETSISPL